MTSAKSVKCRHFGGSYNCTGYEETKNGSFVIFILKIFLIKTIIFNAKHNTMTESKNNGNNKTKNKIIKTFLHTAYDLLIFLCANSSNPLASHINRIIQTVYKAPSAQKCLSPSQTNKNTGINGHKTSPNNKIHANLSEPKPNKILKSTEPKTQHSKSEFTKQELHKWLNNTYQPTHFLTVQLPENWKSNNANNAKSHLRMIMKIFEKNLLGHHWNKKHLPFIAFSELGDSEEWHYHILLNQKQFTEDELQTAISKTVRKLQLSDYCLQLNQIEDHLENTENYCLKELKIYFYGHFDSDRIILSAELFQLPYKPVQ